MGPVGLSFNVFFFLLLFFWGGGGGGSEGGGRERNFDKLCQNFFYVQ